MSHSAPSSSPSGRRKVEVIGGGLILVVGLALVIIAVIALNHPQGRQTAKASVGVSSASTSTSATPKPTAKATTPSAAPSSSRASSSAPPNSTPVTASTRPAVLVLNNTSDPTLTQKAVSRLTAGGWTATDGGSFDGSILSTAVYYDPSTTSAQEAAIALQAQFPAIQRVKQKFDGLPQGALILILTSDYS